LRRSSAAQECYQPVARINRFVTPFRQLNVVSSAFDPPMPLSGNRFVTLFKVRQRFEREFDCEWCDGGQQTFRDRVIERL
jgi:hypothetical protein